MKWSGEWRFFKTPLLSAFSSLAASSESVWFADPKGRILGLISVKTGAVQGLHIPWADAMPAALAANNEGAVCFSTGGPYLVCHRRDVGFVKVKIPETVGYTGRSVLGDPRPSPDHLAIVGDRIWYSSQAKGGPYHYSIGFVSLRS